MSSEKYEIKDKAGNVYKVDFYKVVKTIENMELVTFVKGKIPLDETWEIRQGNSDWYPLTKSFCEELIRARGDVGGVLQGRAQGEKELQRRKQEAINKIHQLKTKCASGEWSLADLQHIFHLVSQIPATPFAASQEVDELSQAQNDLINEVCKNPNLTEPLKIMYSNTQLGMQQQILDNLEQLSSNQAQGNSILKQNQKSGNQKAAIGMLGGMAALNSLDDISDALGGDE